MTAMMRLKNMLAAGWVIAALICVFAEETPGVTTIASGIGPTPETALKNAMSAAVRQAAGTLIDASILTENNEISREKILTANNAIVTTYDIIEPAKPTPNGLYEIKIKAEVKPSLQKLELIDPKDSARREEDTQHILEEVNPGRAKQKSNGNKTITGKVEISQDIRTEGGPREKKPLDMEAMIENAISKIDFRSYLRFSLIGANGTRGNQAKLYMKPNPYDQSKIYVALGLVCVFDSDRFQQECMPRLSRLFDSLPFEERRKFTAAGELGLCSFAFPSGYMPAVSFKSSSAPEDRRRDSRQYNSHYAASRAQPTLSRIDRGVQRIQFPSVRNSSNSSASLPRINRGVQRAQYTPPGNSTNRQYNSSQSGSSSQPQDDRIVRSWKAVNYTRFSSIVSALRASRRNGGLLLDVSSQYRPGWQQFVFYGCSEEHQIQLQHLMKEKQEQLERIFVTVSLLNKEGNEVQRMTKRFERHRGESRIGLYDYDGFVVISPEICSGHSLSQTMIYPLSATVGADDIKEIKSFRLDVRMDN